MRTRNARKIHGSECASLNGHLFECKALLISILRLTEMPNYADYMAEPIEMPFWGQTPVGPLWRHLANTTE